MTVSPSYASRLPAGFRQVPVAFAARSPAALGSGSEPGQVPPVHLVIGERTAPDGAVEFYLRCGRTARSLEAGAVRLAPTCPGCLSSKPAPARRGGRP